MTAQAAVKASGEAEKRAPQPVYTEQECSPFECNICLDLAKEPVVTFCGHLFCWPCLYRWMEVNSHYQTCPVCKSGLDANKVVPIYGRGNDATDPRVETKDSPDSVPSRPAGRRAVPILRAPMVMSQENVNGNQGVIPMLFGFSQGGNTPASEVFSSEQQQQAFLSRLLLMLGSFVIMCLLLF